MEHLFWMPDEEQLLREYESLRDANFAVDDWALWDQQHGHVPIKGPGTPWLGYHHDDVDTEDCDCYWSYINSRPSPHGPHVDPDKLVENFTLNNGHDERVPLLQSWFYIGMLEFYLGRTVRLSMLTRHDEAGRIVLYSRCLNALARGRLRELRSLPEKRKEETYQRLRSGLMNVRAYVTHIYSASNVQEGASRVLVTKTGSAIDGLVETLLFNVEAWNDPSGDSSPKSFSWPDMAVIDRLQERGWCRTQLEQFTGSSRFLFWLDGTGQTPALGSHENCPNDQCVKSNIDETSYVARHDFTNCKCKFVKPSLDNLRSNLNEFGNERISVLTVLETPGGLSIRVDSVEAEEIQLSSQPHYVAFSHVWSHGLGSTTEQGLPECQVRRLGRIASDALETAEPARFWIDSLCIPSEPIMRKMVLSQMRNIYANARHVVILDEALKQMPTKTPNSWLEVTMAILLSDWAHRLWTLQESNLSTSLLVQGSDGFHDAQDLLRVVMQHSVLYPLARHLIGLLGPIMFLAKDYGDSQTNRLELLQILREMSFRTTSKVEDETLVLGGLLGLNNQILASVQGGQRLAAFYSQLRYLPYEIVFRPGPKMNEFPFRWAPKTFLTHSPGQDEDTVTRAQCISAGLDVLSEVAVIQLEHEVEPFLTVTEDLAAPGRWAVSYICFLWDDAERCYYFFYIKVAEKQSFEQANTYADSHRRKDFASKRLDLLLIDVGGSRLNPALALTEQNNFLGIGVLLALGASILEDVDDRITCALTLSGTGIIRKLPAGLNPDDAGDENYIENIQRVKDVPRVGMRWASRRLLIT